MESVSSPDPTRQGALSTMSNRPLATADPKLDATSRGARARAAHPVIPALASAFLLWLAFPGDPPPGTDWLAWFALAPLFLLIRSDRRPRLVYAASWLGGLAFWLLALNWVTRVDASAWLGWAILAAFLALEWPVFLLVGRLSVRRLGLPLMLAAPLAWVAVEYVRAHILTGLPWYYLAHSQYRNLAVIQVCDLAGAWGLSLVMATVNAWWVEVATLPLLRPAPHGPRLARGQALRLGAVAVLVAGTLGYGLARLRTAHFREGPKVALLQSNIQQELKMGSDAETIMKVYNDLIATALARGPKPDLIVWPETSYPYRVLEIDPKVPAAVVDKQLSSIHKETDAKFWRDYMAAVSSTLHERVDRLGTPMMIGSIFYAIRPEGLARHNAAVLWEPNSGRFQAYQKLHLVPFGEYLPSWVKAIPPLRKLLPFQGDNVPNLDFGRAPEWFELKGWRLAAVICFEDTVPHVTRRAFAEAAGKPPDLLVNLSNDGWFRGSAEHDMHLAISVFRCVENRVPLARAVNMGVSAVVDGDGRIVARLDKATEGVVSAVVPLDDRTSLYSRMGDWLPRGCLMVAVGLVVLGLTRPAGKSGRGGLPDPG
jgi:apolipoprotein N-acyltransferase